MWTNARVSIVSTAAGMTMLRFLVDLVYWILKSVNNLCLSDRRRTDMFRTYMGDSLVIVVNFIMKV